MPFLLNTFPVTAFVSIEQSPITTIPPSSSCMHRKTQLLRADCKYQDHRLKFYENHENKKSFTVSSNGGLASSKQCNKNLHLSEESNIQYFFLTRYNTNIHFKKNPTIQKPCELPTLFDHFCG